MTLLQRIKQERAAARKCITKPWCLTQGWEVRFMDGSDISGSPDIAYEGTGRISKKVLKEQYERLIEQGRTDIWVEGRYDGCNSMQEWQDLEYDEHEYWTVEIEEKDFE